ncbi:MAG: hypothetical protein LBB40_06145 [Holophagales bacterium]|jgi:hypothetical protein|nr:hypothetical protein [Holophagales bacterium]
MVSHINELRKNDWELFYFYLDPKSIMYLFEIGLFKKHFGESAWAVILPDGKLVASGNRAPSYEDFEKIIFTTDINKPIPRLRQFLKMNPNNIDARSDLIRHLRASAYRRTKQRLNIFQNSIWENKDEKRYAVLPAAGLILPDIKPFQELRLDPETDLLIWGKYAQELSEAFQNGTWKKMRLAYNASETLPLEVCSPLMRTTFIRLKPIIEQEIVNLPVSKTLWLLWLHFQACVDSENYKFNFFDTIERPPSGYGFNWPPEGAVVPLVRICYDQKNWDMILNLTQKSYLNLKNSIDFEVKAPGFKSAIYIDWNGTFKQRLEALIRLGREKEAEDFIILLSNIEDGRAFLKDAAQLAKSIGAINLANKWQLLIGGVS